MKKKLDDYIYRNLQKYNNCYIPEDVYKKKGEKFILGELKKNGYDCTITKSKDVYFDRHGVPIYEIDYIIEQK